MNRKNFLLNSSIGATALLVNPFSSFAKTYTDVEPYKLEIVKDFVIAGHSKLNEVKQMLELYPNIILPVRLG